MCRCLAYVSLGLLWGAVSGPVISAAERAGGTDRPAELSWHNDYGRAVKAALQEGKLLLIFFGDGPGGRFAKFESHALADPEVVETLRTMVRVKLPVGTTIRVQGESVELLKHDAFAELHGSVGVAVLDFAHRDDPNYGCVVGAFPFAKKPRYTARQIVGLPEVPIEVPTAPAEQAAEQAAEPPHQPPDQPPAEPPAEAAKPGGLDWSGDYAEAMAMAEREGKMMLIVFSAGAGDGPSRRFESDTLAHPQVVEKLKNVVRVTLPVDARVSVKGQRVELLKHASFAEMLGGPGLAMLDFAHRGAPYYGTVVSTFPLLDDRTYNVEQMLAILDLPPGTLTQRTLIYAVRTHPERPASTEGHLDPYLAEEAESHSRYQARIGLQGHHSWETRFHRINAKLPDGLTASEVCAESWPGEGLLEAALECVRCWRFSSGHWAAVRAAHRCYGYDMQRGSNGIWYATGIFGQR